MRAPMLITVLLLYIVATTASVQAGEARAVLQVGFLMPVQRADYDETKDPYKAALLDGLKALGYVEGKNIHIEFRAPKKPEDVAEMVADLVNRKVDVIGTGGPQPIEAVRRATATVPIVIIACDRADRLVASIARPGGNITGMACISSDLASKRLQLLQEVVPAFSRVSVLFNGGVSAKLEEFREIQATAQTMEIEVQSADVRDPPGFATVFAAIKGGNAQALLALSEPLTLSHLKEIAEFAAEQHLPSMYGFREFCDAGGLLCYGMNLRRRYGYFIDKILKGTRPGDIPVEEPTSFELIVNARTAKLLGLSIPNSIFDTRRPGDRIAETCLFMARSGPRGCSPI
jgi:putative tryptophan/tyrosine transport system substrate-binding protein